MEENEINKRKQKPVMDPSLMDPLMEYTTPGTDELNSSIWPDFNDTVQFSDGTTISYNQFTDSLSIRDAGNTSLLNSIKLSDVIGCDLELDLLAAPSSASIQIYRYERIIPNSSASCSSCMCSSSSSSRNNDNELPTTPTTTTNTKEGHKRLFKRVKSHLTLPLQPTMDLAGPRSIVRSIRALSLAKSTSPRRVLTFVNPFSGSKTAMAINDNVLEPMLRESNIEFTSLVTKSENHAYEYMSKITSEEVDTFDGIIVVSGDGLLYSILNAIQNHVGGVEMRDRIMKKISFGIVNAGSGNGLAKSITYANGENLTPMQCVFCILKALGSNSSNTR